MRKKYKRILAFTVTAAAAATAAVYFYYANYYKTHFHPDTMINGIEVSGMTVPEAKAAICDAVDDYTFTIKEQNGTTEMLTAGDVGLVYDDKGEVDRFFASMSPYAWPFDGHSYRLKLDAQFNTVKADRSIKALNCVTEGQYVKMEDACLESLPSGLYALKPEVDGSEIDQKLFKDVLYNAIMERDTYVDIVNDVDCYLHPTVRSDDEALNRRLAQLNLYLGTNCTYPLGENGETLNAETIAPLLRDDGENVTLDTDAVNAMVDGWVDKYVTYGKSFLFPSAAGYDVSISSSGTYGWAFDGDELKADVLEAISTGAQGERTVNFTHKGAGWSHHGMSDNFVEVSIIEQHVWLWNNGEIVAHCNCVTGLRGRRDTVTGCYSIFCKYYKTTLGSMATTGYEAHVDYFLGFYGGYGLHDARWRGSFGGNIYKYNGSHGCVNIPPKIMRTIYENAWEGMPVIVYS